MDEGGGGGGAWDGELRWAIVEKVRGPLVEWRLTLSYRRKLPRRNVKGVCGGGDEGVGGWGGTRRFLRPTYISNRKISSKYQHAIFKRPVNLGEGGMATSQGVVCGGYMSHIGYIAGVFGCIGVK